MSPQVLWTIAGLIVTVLTLAGVTTSNSKTSDAGANRLIASEVGNIAVASKMWIGQKSSDGTFTGITADGLVGIISGMATTGSGATSKLTSKAAPAVAFSVAAVGTPASKVVITLTGMAATQTPVVESFLATKVCTVANVSPSSSTYTCNY